MEFFKNWGKREKKAEAFETDRIYRLLTMGLNYQGTAWNSRAYALEGYSANVVVYRCIRELATAAAAVSLELHTVEGDEEKVTTDHPVLDLLVNPNPMQHWDEFIKAFISSYLYSGNGFLWRNKPGKIPLELHIFNPQHMEVLPGPNMIPSGYKRTVGIGAVSSEVYKVDPLSGESDVLHLKMFNAMDAWVGMSPLQAAAYGVDIHNAGMQFNKALLDNSARPSGALKVPESTGSPDENLVARLREQVRTMNQGAKNAGNVPLLYGGTEWVEMGLSPKDMDFKESMSMAALSIAAAYGVPFPLIVPDAATFANMRDAREAMWENTILPLLDEVLGALSRWLLPLYGLENARLCYNADNVSAMEGKRQRKFERMIRAKDAGIFTINEVRGELGYQEIDGGDMLLVPSSQIPLDMAGLGFDPAAPPTDPEATGKAMRLAGYKPSEIAGEQRNGFGMSSPKG